MKTFILAICLACGACASSCATSAPKPTVTCAAVCTHGAALGCGYAAPTPKGASCDTVCLNASANGEAWNLASLLAATTCP